MEEVEPWRVLGSVPDQPQAHAVKHVISGQRADAHVEEHALQHCLGQKCEHRRHEQRESEEPMNDEVCRALLHHLCRNLAISD